jgi:hypothetical protein
MPRRFRILVAAILLAQGAALVWLAAITPVTDDEPTYLRAGRILARHFDFAPISTVYNGPLPSLANQIGMLFAPDAVRDDPIGCVFWGRLGMILFPLLCSVLLVRCAAVAFGARAALAALALYALNPIVLGHGCLMTADAALMCFSLLTVVQAWHWLRRPSWPRAAAVGGSLGFALATKYLALFLIPVLALTLLSAVVRGKRRPGESVLALLLCGAAALAALHTAYAWSAPRFDAATATVSSGFVASVLNVPGAPAVLGLLPEPFVRGIDFHAQTAASGGATGTQLFGRIGPGFAAYFVVALAVKLPLALLALLGIGLLARRPAWPSRLRTVLCWAIAVPFVYLSLFTKHQIGVRYLLSLVPLLYPIAGRACEALWMRGLGARLLLAALLAWHLGASALAWPHYVQYCNPLAGDRPYLLFNDSNLDWRAGAYPDRDLAAVERRWPSSERVFARSGPRLGLVHVYARDLGAVDPRDRSRAHHWLRAMRPRARVGGWFVFEADEPSWRARAARDPRAASELAVALIGEGRGADALVLLEGSADADAEKVRRAARLQAAGAARAEYADALAAIGRFDLVLGARGELPPALAAQAWLARDQPRRALGVLRAAERAGALDVRGALLLADGLRTVGEFDAALEAMRRHRPPADDPLRAAYDQLLDWHERQRTAARAEEELAGMRPVRLR